MSLEIKKGYLRQNGEYDISLDKNYASLFCVGNGFFNIRGSFEEDTAIGVQGLFIRGFIDKTIEAVSPSYQSIFLKKYYYNEDKLKEWQDTECGINSMDPLSVLIFVNNNMFSMCDGVIESFERKLNFFTGELIREVVWNDGSGNLTKFIFKRFASFKKKNILGQQITIERLNHEKEITILTGVDTRVKTTGLNLGKVTKSNATSSVITTEVSSGELYNFKASLTQNISVNNGKIKGDVINFKNMPFIKFISTDKVTTVEKMSFITTSRDNDKYIKPLTYDEEFKLHLEVFELLVQDSMINFEKDEKLLGKIQFSIYHTLISSAYWDGLHGVAAKGLTGEGYYQFVWWDSEIYQMPFFLYTNPEAAKNTLIYRYNTLDKAKEIARKQGYKGARFAFCSSVTGEEKTWAGTVHPFMQDHIVADVIYATLQYYFATDDKEFMEKYGSELICESIRYWLSRTTKTERGYEIRKIAGTDEHHWNVNNDAYTNYLVKYALNVVYDLLKKNILDFSKNGFSSDELCLLEEQAKDIFINEKMKKMIPQFDGYFNLSKTMESNVGSGSGPQMRYKGSYMDSQIIKQPDVLMLYSYVDVIDDHSYLKNDLKHYLNVCECSSSLSYAPHAVCCAEANKVRKFKKYLEKTISIDLENLHGGVESGVHSGCEAGGYLSILFGLLGFRNKLGTLHLNPRKVSFIKHITVPFTFKNTKFLVKLNKNKFIIELLEGNPIDLFVSNKQYHLENKIEIRI